MDKKKLTEALAMGGEAEDALLAANLMPELPVDVGIDLLAEDQANQVDGIDDVAEERPKTKKRRTPASQTMAI